jgi:metallophosphoesterase (TIGR00282 family)
MIGDVVGEPGLAVLEARLPRIIRERNADFTVVNGENAADGFGLTEATLRRILASGADVVTSGNHVWEKRDVWPLLDTERVLRPANYPGSPVDPADSKIPGKGWLLLKKACPESSTEISCLVINLQGREFMSPIDCPFRCFDEIFDPENPLVLVDFHAESTREKESLAYYLDGRASLVAGTHTHVQTADERILPGGTGYISDLGMTGVTDSVIGMDPAICLERVRKQILYRMEPAAEADPNNVKVQGITAEIDRNTGKTLSIQRL